jgi:uncharacterized protein
MIRVELAKIIIDEKNNEQAIVLKEKGGTRQIPIIIGFVEATSIQMRISGITTPRPLTHDLLVAVIRALEAQIEFLLIDDLTEGTFYAKLNLKTKDGEIIIVDCRPSDGISLAVRLNMPVFVEEKIFDQVLSSGV